MVAVAQQTHDLLELAATRARWLLEHKVIKDGITNFALQDICRDVPEEKHTEFAHSVGNELINLMGKEPVGTMLRTAADGATVEVSDQTLEIKAPKLHVGHWSHGLPRSRLSGRK